MQRSDSPNEAEAIKTANLTDYENRLILMESNIQDVKHFWELFNNFDITKMPLKDSVHLFHQGIKPVWEDPRNVKGGSWTFRVPKEKAPQFWKEVCVMAVGDELQKAVASDRTSMYRHTAIAWTLLTSSQHSVTTFVAFLFLCGSLQL